MSSSGRTTTQSMIWPHLWEALLMIWTRLWRLIAVKVCLVCDCSGLSMWIFMSPTRQASRGRSRSCSVNMVSMIVSSVGWWAVQTEKCSVLCCKVIDACTTSYDVWVKSKSVLNMMLEPKIHVYVIAIPPPRDRNWRGNDFTLNPLGAS